MTARVSVTDLIEEAGEKPVLFRHGKLLLMRQAQSTTLVNAIAFEERCNMPPLADDAARLYLAHAFLL